MIRIRRIYDPEETGERYKVLIDRLWPRGISKKNAGCDEWMREIAPADGLRKWFAHDPGKWEQFKKLYRNELIQKQEELRRLKLLENLHGTLTLLFAAKDTVHNNAVVLKEVLQEYKIS